MFENLVPILFFILLVLTTRLIYLRFRHHTSRDATPFSDGFILFFLALIIPQATYVVWFHYQMNHLQGATYNGPIEIVFAAIFSLFGTMGLLMQLLIELVCFVRDVAVDRYLLKQLKEK